MTTAFFTLIFVIIVSLLIGLVSISNHFPLLNNGGSIPSCPDVQPKMPCSHIGSFFNSINVIICVFMSKHYVGHMVD